MKTFLKNNLNALVMILCELIVGILLLIKPVGFTRGILMALGAALAVKGLLGAMRYFRTEPRQAAKEQGLAQNLALLLVGGFCLFRSEWFIATFPMLTMVYGVLILFGSLYKIQQAVDIMRMKSGNPLWSGIDALLMLVFGIVTLSSPFGTISALWIFIGVSLLVEAAFDIAVIVLNMKKTA